MVCREEGKQSVLKPLFLLFTVATDPSFLHISVCFIDFQLSGLKRSRGPLHTGDYTGLGLGFIKNE